MADQQGTWALREWIAVAVLLLGCAAVCAGVIAIVLDHGVAAALIIGGAAVAVVGAVVWTLIVKLRDPSPRAARREF